MPAIEFIDNEDGYTKWISDNPNGYVVNTHKNLASSYCVLHTAGCRHITSHRNAGAFTTRQYVKICSDNLKDLQKWVRTKKPAMEGFGKECGTCNPKRQGR